MRTKDYVHLKQPFRPSLTSPITYQFGIVVALIVDESTTNVTDVLVQLCDPDHNLMYVDEFGSSALHRFLVDEIEPL